MDDRTRRLLEAHKRVVEGLKETAKREKTPEEKARMEQFKKFFEERGGFGYKHYEE